jgi:hypothetical protein
MDKSKEIAKLFRALADLFDDMGDAAESRNAAWGNQFVMRQEAATPTKPKTKWVTYRLELAQPIGKPKAARIIERVKPVPGIPSQLSIVMGQGSASRQAVIAFDLRVTNSNGDGKETADFVAGKINKRGSDLRARAKISSVVMVD